MLSFVFLYLFTSANDFAITIAALIVFCIGAISDALDGWFARRYRIVSKFGEHYDPLADKFLTISAFVAFSIMGIVPQWCVVLIVMRDVITTILRYAFFTRRHIETSRSAKLKTIVQLVFIIFILVLRIVSETGNSAAGELLTSDYVFVAMLFVTAITLWTMVEYIIQILGNNE